MAVTITKPTIGGSEDSWGLTINTALDAIVDGLNGVTAIEPNLTAGSWEIGGVAVGSSAAELNILDGATLSTAEINLLSGVTASTTEINYLAGVTSSIQTQINDLVTGALGGTVTSVGLSAPTGFSVSGSPVTSSGTLSLSFSSGYSLLTSAQATSISNIPTNTSQLTNDSGFITSQYSQPTGFGDVGTYAFLVKNGSSVASGSSYSGSSLQSSGVNANQSLTANNNVYNASATGLARGDTTMSGTWRAMGSVSHSSSSTYGRGTVFLRIS